MNKQYRIMYFYGDDALDYQCIETIDFETAETLARRQTSSESCVLVCAAEDKDLKDCLINTYEYMNELADECDN